MDPKVLLVLQEHQHRIGNGADAQLQRVAVADERRAVFPDGLLYRSDLRRLQLDDRRGVLHENVNILHWHQALRTCPGHLIVHLRDNAFCLFDGRQRVVHGNTQRAHTVLVRRRYHHQCRIQRQRGIEQLRHPIEEYRGKISASLKDRVAAVASGKNGVVAEILRIRGLAVFALAHRYHMHDLHIAVILGVLHHDVQ